jgi:hypothetical protein
MRSVVKVLVIVLLAGFVGAQFFPDVIQIPKWPPRLPRVEVVHERTPIYPAAVPAPVATPAPAPAAAVPPDTVQLPPVAAAPSIDAAKAARKAKAIKRAKPKPKVQELPEEDGAFFSTEPTAMIVPVRITTSVELVGSSREIPTPAAPEIKNGDEWPVVCGEIVDANGAGVDGADVRIDGTDITERTDPKGRFCLVSPVRKLTLLVGASGRDSVRYVVELEGKTTQVRVTLQ